MPDERKENTEKEQEREKLKKRLDPMTTVVAVSCAAVFAGFAVSGLKHKNAEDGDSVPDETSVSMTTLPATTTVTTTAVTSAETTAPTTRSTTTSLTTEKKTSLSSTSKTSTASVKTLTMTTTTVTTTAVPTETAAQTTETEPPSTTTETAPETTTATMATTTQTTTSAQSFPADINTISYEGLLEIPGIGEKLARQIIDFREANGTIYNLEQLMGIYGIGEGTLAQLRAFLYVSAADYSELTTTTTTTVTVRETETQAPAQRQQVRLNSADAEELSQKLLISLDKAAAIIEVRGKIGRFSSVDELRLVDKLTAEDLRDIKDYVIID